jgi:hypothetical protein
VPEKSRITWSPDGTEVVFADETGQAWTIKANCTPAPDRGCEAASRTTIKEVPLHWLPDFYPQWAGEETNSAPANVPATRPASQPSSTAKPLTSWVKFDWPTGCQPNPVTAGVVVFIYGIGSGTTDSGTALKVIGQDTFGTITINGQAVPPATSAQAKGLALDSHGRTLQVLNCSQDCSLETYAAIQLGPGQYDVRAEWPRADGNPDPRSCTLTVTAP